MVQILALFIGLDHGETFLIYVAFKRSSALCLGKIKKRIYKGPASGTFSGGDLRRTPFILLFVVVSAAAILFNSCGQAFHFTSKFSSNEQSSQQSSRLLYRLSNTTAESLLTRKCSSCHNGELALGGIKSVVDESYLAATGLVRFGDPEGSPLYQSLAQKRMPASGDYLDEVELSVIHDWILGVRESEADVSQQCLKVAAAASRPLPARVWPITPQQYANIIEDGFGVTGDWLAGLPAAIEEHGFSHNKNHTTFDDFLIFEYQNVADAISSRIAGDSEVLLRFWTCTTSLASVGPECVQNFIAKAGLLLFRRPLVVEELARYKGVYDAGGDQAQPVQFGAKLVLQAMLFSPNFIYRKEFGATEALGSRALTSYQIAEFLAFSITDSAPDAPLLALAANNQLLVAQVRSQEIQRLLQTKRGKRFMGRFIADLLDVERLVAQSVNAPDSTTFKQSALEEFQLFIENAMGSTDSLASILAGRSTFINQVLGQQVYGVQGYGTDFRPYSLPPKERGGVLSLPAFLASTAAGGAKPFLRRGALIRERLLCQPLGKPPPNVDGPPPESLPANFADLSPRIQFELLHLKQKSCAGCHSQIDPIGFGMHHFSVLGVFAPNSPETGAPLDVSGFVANTAQTNFSFTGVSGLADGLSQSDEVRECIAQKIHEYVAGQMLQVTDQCQVQKSKMSLIEYGGDLKLYLNGKLNEATQFLRESR